MASRPGAVFTRTAFFLVMWSDDTYVNSAGQNTGAIKGAMLSPFGVGQTFLISETCTGLGFVQGEEAQATLLSDERNFLGLALVRGRREGPTDDIVYGRFKHLIRHVQRSLRAQLALDGEAAEIQLGELATVNCRTILLDRHGCLSAISASAEPLFEGDGPARLDGLTFGLRHREENRGLHRAMGRLLSKRSDAPLVHEMRAGRTSSHPDGQWTLSLIRLPDRPNCLGFGPALALSFHPLSGKAAQSGAGQALN